MALNTHSADFESTSSQYLSITDAAQTGLGITGDLTLEAWFKLESKTAGTVYGLFSKWGSIPVDYSYRAEIRDNTIRILLSSDGSTLVIKTPAFTSSVGEWTHVAIAYDASAGSVDLYRNGSFLSTTTGFGTSLNDTTKDFAIGRTDIDYDGDYFDGLMDEVRIWNDVRTSTEISDNYNKELVGNEANLQGYWKFNNDAFVDYTANNNDLTNNNGVIFSTDVPFPGTPTASFIPSITIF